MDKTTLAIAAAVLVAGMACVTVLGAMHVVPAADATHLFTLVFAGIVGWLAPALRTPPLLTLPSPSLTPKA